MHLNADVEDSASMQEQSRIKRLQSVSIVDYLVLLENTVVMLQRHSHLEDAIH